MTNVRKPYNWANEPEFKPECVSALSINFRPERNKKPVIVLKENNFPVRKQVLKRVKKKKRVKPLRVFMLCIVFLTILCLLTLGKVSFNNNYVQDRNLLVDVSYEEEIIVDSITIFSKPYLLQKEVIEEEEISSINIYGVEYFYGVDYFIEPVTEPNFLWMTGQKHLGIYLNTQGIGVDQISEKAYMVYSDPTWYGNLIKTISAEADNAIESETEVCYAISNRIFWSKYGGASTLSGVISFQYQFDGFQSGNAGWNIDENHGRTKYLHQAVSNVFLENVSFLGGKSTHFRTQTDTCTYDEIRNDSTFEVLYDPENTNNIIFNRDGNPIKTMFYCLASEVNC